MVLGGSPFVPGSKVVPLKNIINWGGKIISTMKKNSA